VTFWGTSGQSRARVESVGSRTVRSRSAARELVRNEPELVGWRPQTEENEDAVSLCSKNGEGGPLKIGQAVAASRGRIASWFLSGNCQGHPYGLGQHFIWVPRTRLRGIPTSPT